MISLMKKELTSLFVGGNKPSETVILSRYRHANSGIASKREMCGMSIVECADISDISGNALNYFTAQSFKGLESNIVFYIDVDGFTSSRDRMLNYVAMSRAKILLYVFYKKDIKSEYLEISIESHEKFA